MQMKFSAFPEAPAEVKEPNCTYFWLGKPMIRLKGDNSAW